MYYYLDIPVSWKKQNCLSHTPSFCEYQLVQIIPVKWRSKRDSLLLFSINVLTLHNAISM